MSRRKQSNVLALHNLSSVSTSRVGFYSGDRLIHTSGSFVVAADLGSAALHRLHLIRPTGITSKGSGHLSTENVYQRFTSLPAVYQFTSENTSCFCMWYLHRLYITVYV